jgi:ABC-2 type transport system ATP-binding protein
MIITEDLSKAFNDFLAVDGVSIAVGSGEVLALLGPNGAGKTTTVRMLTSVLKPSRGRARVAGYDVVKQPQGVRSSVGVLTENHGLYNRMPAEDYLDFFGQLYQMEDSARKARVRELLEDFDLSQRRKNPVGEFSKGMRQKLALARALLHSPPVLLLDEPTSAMDPQSARLVRDAIHDLRSAERAIVICTHNLVEAEELADRIAIIRTGQIIANGTPDELKLRFLGPTEYEIRLGSDLNGWEPQMPPEVELTDRGVNWVRYRTLQAQNSNPQVLRTFLDGGHPVISLEIVPRSLEQVYLEVIRDSEREERSDVS